MKYRLAIILLFVFALMSYSQPRERALINNGWLFHLGYAGDMMKDYTHGTEYFTYLTKARSNNGNTGPAAAGFDDSSWQSVNLPHDWVVDLPFCPDASKSHGYKCVGWRYPEHSAGWYRKHIFIPEQKKGMRFLVEFEGIFRDSQVFCNGFYLGSELSGYLSSTYAFTDYILWGADNVITVRADASLEEGWFYEGAGIYRNVYLHEVPVVAVEPYEVRAAADIDVLEHKASLSVDTGLIMKCAGPYGTVYVQQLLYDACGNLAASSGRSSVSLVPFHSCKASQKFDVSNVRFWDIDDPYLYSLHTCILDEDWNVLDEICTDLGLRKIEFDPDIGFFLNDRRVELKGVDLHQDHAGVGSGIPDALLEYRISRLKSFGCNAIRSSHNPASPALLSLCDHLGMLVIDENRLMGTNDYHFSQLGRVIERSIISDSISIN